MTEPISGSWISITAAGVTVFGIVTGLDPALMFASACGGWWAMTYHPPMKVFSRLNRLGLSALIGGWGTPVFADIAQKHMSLSPEGLPAFKFVVALVVGLVALDILGGRIRRLAEKMPWGRK